MVSIVKFSSQTIRNIEVVNSDYFTFETKIFITVKLNCKVSVLLTSTKNNFIIIFNNTPNSITIRNIYVSSWFQ